MCGCRSVAENLLADATRVGHSVLLPITMVLVALNTSSGY
jgi:hypothetical protein